MSSDNPLRRSWIHSTQSMQEDEQGARQLKAESVFLYVMNGPTSSHAPGSPEEFSNSLSMSTFLIGCIRNVSDNKKLTALKTLFEKSVSRVWVQRVLSKPMEKRWPRPVGVGPALATLRKTSRID